MSMDIHFCVRKKDTEEYTMIADLPQIWFLPYHFYSDFEGCVLDWEITREQVCNLIDRCKEYIKDNSKFNLLLLLKPEELAKIDNLEFTLSHMDITPSYADYVLGILENTVLPAFDNLKEDEVITFDAW